VTEALKREKWIILSHAFNMDGRAASQTITDKIPFFLKKGIEPIVISAITGRKDDIIEHHQLLPWAPSGLKFDLRHWVKLNIKNKGLQKGVKALFSVLLLPFFLIERLLLPLETHWSWFMPAAVRAVILARRHKAHLIFSTGGANSAHLAGYLAAKWTGLPWIVEVHDPMIYEGMDISWMRYKWAAWLEGLICRNAELPWWFTTAALERARARHPTMGTRGILIYPGAEEPDYQNAIYSKKQILHFGHFGSLNPTRNLREFLLALSEVFKDKPELKSLSKLHVYGSSLDAVSRACAEELDLMEVIHCHGRLETDPVSGKSGRQQVLEAMRTCDVLILLHGTGKFCEEYVPSKFYEYAWTKRPILGLIDHGKMLEDMLVEMGGISVYKSNIGQIKMEILNLYDRWTQNLLSDRLTPSPYTTQSAVENIVEHVRGTHGR
jgi:hypothetical protein